MSILEPTLARVEAAEGTPGAEAQGIPALGGVTTLANQTWGKGRPP